MNTLQHFSTRLLTISAIIALAGCTTIPAPLEGEFSDFYPEQAIDRSIGAQVRWGGTVIETVPLENQTCVEVLARELDRSYRPNTSDRTYGRFLACRPVFLDPEVFVNGREVTVVGRVGGFDQGKVGEFVYEYPRVEADSIYLWPEYVGVNQAYYGSAFWGWPYARFGYYNFGFRSYYPSYYRSSGGRQGTVHQAPDSVQRSAPKK